MTPTPTVGAVILAAGMSRRYGSPKQLVRLHGRTLLEHALEAAEVAGLSPTAAVVPVWLSRPAGLDSPALRWVRNPFPERGLALSLRLGLDALGDTVEAAIILLGDQPRVPASTIAALLGARGDRPLIAAEAAGILAPPVLIERTHFHLAATLLADSGLRGVIRNHPEMVTAVPVPRHSPDVDTLDDLGRLRDP